jgi:hypothetical protein
MGKPETLKIAGCMVGLLVIGILTADISFSPMDQIKKTLRQALGVKATMLNAPILEARERANASGQFVKNMLPAGKGKGENPEDLELRKNPPPPHPGRGEPKSKADLMRACEQQPKCRQKLNEAKRKGKPQNPRPAKTGKSPEELELEKFPAPPQPAGGLDKRKGDLQNFPVTTLLGWLNPFSPLEVQAQSDVSIYLTPCNKRHSMAGLQFHGVELPFSNPYARFVPYTKTNRANTDYKPYLTVHFKAPATGWYILNFRATRAAAKLRHQYNGSIIETWDFMSQPNGWYNYATIEYLAQGSHIFLWWGTQGWPHLSSVNISSFP